MHSIVNSELQLLCKIPLQASSLTKDLFTFSWTSGVQQENEHYIEKRKGKIEGARATGSKEGGVKKQKWSPPYAPFITTSHV